MQRSAISYQLSALWLMVTWAVPLAAQGASPYLPASHWATPYVELLITRGRIPDPTPLTRPFKTADVVRALGEADTLRLSTGERHIVRAIIADLTIGERGPWGRLDVAAGVAGANYSRRDPLRADSTGHFTGSGGLNVALRFGPVVAVTHPVVDTRLKYDPDWYGKKDRKIAGRAEEAYIAAQWRYAELFFGNLDRNWGPSAVQGLLLSDNPYSLTHFGLALGTTGVQLQAYVTQLDTRDSAGQPVNRYMVQHRLWIRPPGGWTFALWEGSVTSGVGRQLEPWFLNIMTLGYVEQLNSGTNANSFFGLDFQHRGGVTVFGQFLLDDIQVDKQTAADQKPMSYGFTVGGQGALGGAAWTLYYTQVANLTYRNEDSLQVPLWHDLGTGRNYSDYDQITARLTTLTRPGILLAPEVTLLRQGEGDPRLPHPTVAQYPTTATLFQGVVERTLRVAGLARWDRGPISLQGDAGVHFVHNASHVDGASATRFVGSVGLTYRLHWESALP